MQLNIRRTVAGLYLLIAMMIGTPVQASEIDIYEFWTVAEVEGTVLARSGENPWSKPQPVIAGERIGPYSVVEAGSDSEAILVRGGDRMTLYANTEIELPPTDRATGITRILQRTGEVLFRIKKRNRRDFEVQTPYLVAGVRGTTFGVTATDATSQLHVVEGAVAIRSIDDAAAVETIISALENATAGVGISAQSSAAQMAAIDAWDDRTFHQAETCDHLMLNGPLAVQEALSHRPLFAADSASDASAVNLTDVEDLAMRIAEREKLAIDRATLEPTARNRSMANLAQSSSVRLASAGLALDAFRQAAPSQTQPATAIAPPVPAETAAPAAVNPAPNGAAPIRRAAPAATAPRAPAPATGTPRRLRTPQSVAPTVAPAIDGADADEAADLEITQPAGDGVVYTTFGVDAEDDEGQPDDPEKPILLPQPDLNIEGVGAEGQ